MGYMMLKNRGGSWTISTGERVEIEAIEQDLKWKNSSSDKQPSPKKLRSSSSFEYKTYCLYCCQAITEKKFRDYKAFK